MGSASDQGEQLTSFSASQSLMRARPFLLAQAVCDSTREEQSVQDTLVLDQHAVGGAACEAHVHPELTRAVVLDCINEGLRLRG
jgi:hypothetical protein